MAIFSELASTSTNWLSQPPSLPTSGRTKIPGEASLEVGLRVADVTLQPPGTGNAHGQTRLPLTSTAGSPQL